MKKKLLALVLALLLIPAVMALAAQAGYADSMMKDTHVVVGGDQSITLRSHVETGGRGGYTQLLYAVSLTGRETRAELDAAARKLLTGDGQPVWDDGKHCYHGGNYALDPEYTLRANDLKPGTYLYVCYAFACDGGYNHNLTPYYDRISTVAVRVTEKAEGLDLRFTLVDSRGQKIASLTNGQEAEIPLTGGVLALKLESNAAYPVERVLAIRTDFPKNQAVDAFRLEGEKLTPVLCGSGSVTVTIGNYLDDETRTETVYLTVACGAMEDYTVLEAPTCTEDGLAVYRCMGYGVNCETEFEEIVVPALGHSVPAVEEVLLEPTATRPGLGLGTCEVCGEMGAERAIDPIFGDVTGDSFYSDALDHCYEMGWVAGLTGDSFGPLGSCVRAQVVTFLWRAAGKPQPEAAENPFVDVKEGEFYYDAVLWALEQGITTGTDADHFSPLGACNRAQVVTFLWRAFGQPEIENGELPFNDVQAGSWYEQPVRWAVEEGITSGISPTAFAPTNECNRAQIVTFLYRAYTEN